MARFMRTFLASQSRKDDGRFTRGRNPETLADLNLFVGALSKELCAAGFFTHFRVDENNINRVVMTTGKFGRVLDFNIEAKDGRWGKLAASRSEISLTSTRRTFMNASCGWIPMRALHVHDKMFFATPDASTIYTAKEMVARELSRSTLLSPI